MKLKILPLITLLISSTASAGDDMANSQKILEMDLTSGKGMNPEGSIVVQIHPTDDETDAELEAKASALIEYENADVIDAVSTEAEEIKKIKVEIGADHDPRNYPKFLASVFTLDFSNPLIPVENIVDGGVVVDEISTLVNPLVIPIKEAQEYLHFNDDEYMAVVEINGDARAYPLSVLNWHQGVNDEIGGQPVFVVYDPLSGNVVAIDRRVAGKKETTFGVTGQVYKSASLYYDRATKSVWSAFENMAISGSLSGKRMVKYDAVLTTWKEFTSLYPQGVVLDMMNTGYERNYRQNPYGDYAKNNEILFKVPYANETFRRKEYMIGMRLYKGSRRIEAVVPVNTLINYKQDKVDMMFEQVDGVGFQQVPLTFEVKKPYGTIKVSSSDVDVRIETFYGYWFVWSAYNPNSRLIKTLD
ncbi:MAG: hypothetical protein ACI9TY_000036 [Alphaproteobacteria bacterium]|jgi:hypothetical protein